MNCSIALYCESDAELLEDFFKSVLRQTHPVHEIICLFNQSSVETVQLCKKMKSISPFPVYLTEINTKSPTKAFLEVLPKLSGDVILFARSDYLFHPQKVRFFVEAAKKNPYEFFFFANTSVASNSDENEIYDLFGISGFHERWDYYKNLTNILVKQIGFTPAFQTGISRKGAEKICSFYQDYHFIPNMDFGHFLAIFFALTDLSTIREIPYVLTKHIRNTTSIQQILNKNRTLNYSLAEHLEWLNAYKDVATLIDQNHPAINKIEQAIEFHHERQNTKTNVFIHLINFLSGKYHRYSFEPISELRKDLQRKT